MITLDILSGDDKLVEERCCCIKCACVIRF